MANIMQRVNRMTGEETLQVALPRRSHGTNNLAIMITLYEARTHAKEWGRRNEDGQGFPYFPDETVDHMFGMKIVNRDATQYVERSKIPIAAFTGKLDQRKVEAVLSNAKQLAAGARSTWDVPPGEAVDMSPKIQEWVFYLATLPLAEKDVDYSLERPKFFPWPRGGMWQTTRTVTTLQMLSGLFGQLRSGTRFPRIRPGNIPGCNPPGDKSPSPRRRRIGGLPRPRLPRCCHCTGRTCVEPTYSIAAEQTVQLKGLKRYERTEKATALAVVPTPLSPGKPARRR
jgi:hypothetical protein